MPDLAVTMDSLHDQAIALARSGVELEDAIEELLRLSSNQRVLVETARRMLLQEVRARPSDGDALGGFVIASLAIRRLR